MVSEHLIKQTMLMFNEIVKKLIEPEYKINQGGKTIRIIRTALQNVEKRYGVLTGTRIVDYVVSCSYTFKNRGSKWQLSSVFGPKTFDKFSSDKGRKYFEDKWLQSAQLNRTILLDFLIDKSEHPKAKFIYLSSEEGTKIRLLNRDVGFAICQASTLGWSPLSDACSQCLFIEKCKIETANKYPEIYRLRIEYVNK